MPARISPDGYTPEDNEARRAGKFQKQAEAEADAADKPGPPAILRRKGKQLRRIRQLEPREDQGQ